MTNTDLKDLVRNDLNEIKEKERLKRIKEHSSLKEIILYTTPNNVMCENYKKFFTSEGIKFIEKNIEDNKEVLATVQMAQYPIIYINENYLVHGREFMNPQSAIGAINHFANPNFVNPPVENRLIESIKNLNYNMSKSIQSLSRQLQPVVRIINQIAEEEKKENEQKNK